jgi:large subunit ribosomal protein L18
MPAPYGVLNKCYAFQLGRIHAIRVDFSRLGGGMLNKKVARARRAARARNRIHVLKAHRLCVHRTPRHIYAQLIAPTGAEVLACASTLESEVRQGVRNTGNIEAATQVGKLIAERAKAKGITQVAFDRAGFKYHGRIKALADAAREGGLKF